MDAYEQLSGEEITTMYKKRLKELESSLLGFLVEEAELLACGLANPKDLPMDEIEKATRETGYKITFGRARIKAVKRLIQEASLLSSEETAS